MQLAVNDVLEPTVVPMAAHTLHIEMHAYLRLLLLDVGVLALLPVLALTELKGDTTLLLVLALPLRFVLPPAPPTELTHPFEAEVQTFFIVPFIDVPPRLTSPPFVFKKFFPRVHEETLVR